MNNREIKFRAWDKDRLAIRHDILIKYKPIALPLEEEVFDFEGTKLNCELMQYTGLKDDNDIEIYEGDIVLHVDKDREVIGVVAWDSNFAWLGLCIEMGKYPVWYFNRDSDWWKDCEVIGNMYENPELLEK